MKKYIKADDDFGYSIQSVVENPTLEFEISECNAPLDDIIEAIEKTYRGWKFNRTEERYDTCIIAVFEPTGDFYAKFQM